MKNQFSLPYSLDFAQFGALPADWVGVGAAISGGRLVITPTISGDELLTDGGLEAWTSATNLTNWTEGKAGT